MLTILFNQYAYPRKHGNSGPDIPLTDEWDDIKRDDEELIVLIPAFMRVIDDANTK